MKRITVDAAGDTRKILAQELRRIASEVEHESYFDAGHDDGDASFSRWELEPYFRDADEVCSHDGATQAETDGWLCRTCESRLKGPPTTATGADIRQARLWIAIKVNEAVRGFAQIICAPERLNLLSEEEREWVEERDFEVNVLEDALVARLYGEDEGMTISDVLDEVRGGIVANAKPTTKPKDETEPKDEDERHAEAIRALPEATRRLVEESLRIRAMDFVADRIGDEHGSDLAADVYRKLDPQADETCAFDPDRPAKPETERRRYTFEVEVAWDVTKGKSPTPFGLECLVLSALDSLKDDLNDYHDEENNLDALDKTEVEHVRLVGSARVGGEHDPRECRDCQHEGKLCGSSSNPGGELPRRTREKKPARETEVKP